MSLNLVISEEAEKDIRDAVEWYQFKAAHLGSEFLTCLGSGLSLIRRNPQMFPVVYKSYRRILIRRFPYQIIYMVSDSVIIVLAVFHTKRNPEKWKAR